MSCVPIADAGDEARFGGKAAQLAAAARGGLPVPAAWALEWTLVDRAAAGDPAARAQCARAFTDLGGGLVSVRSSAVGEDSGTASFAGQHLTRLGVRSPEDTVEGVAAVWASGRSPAARAYRERLGVSGEPRMGVVIQRLIAAECAGVLFTRDPVTGEDWRVAEGTWGLGEAVVAGLVDPDRYRFRRGVADLTSTAGDKEVAVEVRPDGSVENRAVEPARRAVLCLDRARIEALDALASACERLFPSAAAHDIEWAFDRDGLHLLQRRSVTR